MPNYYIDPKTADLIIYDPEEKEIRVIKVIEETEYEEEEKPEKPRRKDQKIEEDQKFCPSCNQLKPFSKFRAKGHTKRGIKTFERKCKECENTGKKPRRQYKVDDKTIEKIRSMEKDGAKTRNISTELGIAYSTVYKYTKGMEKPGGSESKPDSPPKKENGFKAFSGEKSQKENEDANEKPDEKPD